MKVNFKRYISSLLALVWASILIDTSKMAVFDTFANNLPRARLSYTRNSLIRLSRVSKTLPCPSLQDWVPQNTACPTQCHAVDAVGEVTSLPSPSWSMSRDQNKQHRPKGRRRGRRGGVRIRARKTKNTLPLPSIIFSNVRSLGKNKENFNLESLHANVKFLSEFRDSGLLCFTETWWTEDTPKENTFLEGFGYPFRGDRNRDLTNKQSGGGVCVYVNDRWCRKKAVIVRETVSVPDVDSLTLSFRPDYLPREFGQIFLTVVYLHPNAKVDSMKIVRDSVDKITAIAPLAPHFICGDFNRLDLRKEAPNLQQYVTCATRKNNILDKFYGNIKDAFRSLQRPPIGGSDHNVLFMLPKYVKKLKKEPIEIKYVKVWNDDSVEKMKACLETTDWNVLNGSENVSENADVIASYIKFCEEESFETKK